MNKLYVRPGVVERVAELEGEAGPPAKVGRHVDPAAQAPAVGVEVAAQDEAVDAVLPRIGGRGGAHVEGHDAAAEALDEVALGAQHAEVPRHDGPYGPVV